MSHAIISGGSSGIGLALAHLLVSDGWNITIIARAQSRLDEAQKTLDRARKTPQQRVVAFSADVADAAALDAAVASSIQSLGAPDLLVASAGIVIPAIFEELPAEAFRQTMDVNYFGTVNLVRAALPAMRARGQGRIVLVSSGAGLIGLYGYTAYAPTKFAVRGFAEALRGELAPDGVGVSVVFPPDTDTPQLHEEVRVRPAITSKIAGGARTHSAEEVARAILKGVRNGQFAIAPGFEMKALASFGGIIGPLLNRFSFDPMIARMRNSSRNKTG